MGEASWRVWLSLASTFTVLILEQVPLAAQSPSRGFQESTRGKQRSHLGRSPEGFHPSTGCPPGLMHGSSPVGKTEAGLWPGGLRDMECLRNRPANLFPQPHVCFSAASAAQGHSGFFLRPRNPEPPK